MSPGSESVVGAAFLQKATVQHMVGIKNDGLKEREPAHSQVGKSSLTELYSQMGTSLLTGRNQLTSRN